jgi:hypothetical protein
VSSRLQTTPVGQNMAFVTVGRMAGTRILDLVEADTSAAGRGMLMDAYLVDP